MIAIIAGLLAMHPLGAEDHEARTVVSVATLVDDSGALVGAPDGYASATACEGAVCETSHLANAATCLLALLPLLVLISRAPSEWMSTRHRSQRGRSTSVSFTSESPTLRPSLIALAISRT
ncbi:DUF6153 family protein [Microbacterium sp. Leaf179]|uniref:DUF6153 family protein n=1 Tax=Microbacterium sp. Leaf179 TaxID=1736288 RepID=UPI003FA5AA8B